MDYSNLIAVTNRKLSVRPFYDQIRVICSTHPRALILREKDLPETEYEAVMRNAMQICGSFGVPFAAHYFTGAAIRNSVRQIHLPLQKLRELPGEERKKFERIGSSVHSVQEAREAVRLGADYLTAGHVFLTKCKEGVPARGLEFLQEVCRAVDVPVYAIGGINLEEERIRLVTEAGAAGAAVMSGFMMLSDRSE